MSTPAAAKSAKPSEPKPETTKTPAAVAAAKGAALPDASLLERETDGPAVVAAPPRRSRWLPAGPWRWVAIAGVSLIVAAGSAAAAFVGLSRAPAPQATIVSGPAQALSGATLVIAGETVRLDDIDAPPASHICRDGKWEYRCGEEARRALEKEIRGRTVECLRTPTANGSPALAQCHNDLGVDLAAALVANGWAVIDIKRSTRYLPQQARAQSENLGLWRNDFALPEQWRLSAANAR